MSTDVVIASEPAQVFRALLNPEAIHAWWSCTVVIDAREGGLWAGAWTQGEGGLGHETVLEARLTEYVPSSAFTLDFGANRIRYLVAVHPQGSVVTVTQTDAQGGPMAENIESWVAAATQMKDWVEAHHPFVAPTTTTPTTTAPVATAAQPEAAPPSGIQGAAGTDPYAAQIKNGQVEIADPDGIGLTDPSGVIKAYQREQGFGTVTSTQLGDLSFDYDGCDFDPAPGDPVLILAVKKGWGGRVKVKRLACPAKGSNIQ